MIYIQELNYCNVSFRCVRFHHYDHVVQDCLTSFLRNEGNEEAEEVKSKLSKTLEGKSRGGTLQPKVKEIKETTKGKSKEAIGS